MKIETILNAMEDAKDDIEYLYDYWIPGADTKWNRQMGHRLRQVCAFRDRIIRMDEEKDAEIDGLLKFYLQAINLYPNLENLR